MASEDDLIYSVCQKTGLSWEEARSLVEQEKKEHFAEIEKKQIPLKFSLSIIFLLLGVIITIGPIIFLWNMLDITKALVILFSGESVVSMETAIKLLGSRCALLSWFELPAYIFTIMSGVGIIIANMQYMRDYWMQIFWNMDLSD